MKKVISVKEILIVITSVILITMTSTVFAINPVLGDEEPSISKEEYEDAKKPKEENNITNDIKNETTNDKANQSTNNNTKNSNVQKYNTNKNNTNLPQTGIEDYNIGILLIICIASAMYAYRKINDYRSI